MFFANWLGGPPAQETVPVGAYERPMVKLPVMKSTGPFVTKCIYRWPCTCDGPGSGVTNMVLADSYREEKVPEERARRYLGLFEEWMKVYFEKADTDVRIIDPHRHDS